MTIRREPEPFNVPEQEEAWILDNADALPNVRKAIALLRMRQHRLIPYNPELINELDFAAANGPQPFRTACTIKLYMKPEGYKEPPKPCGEIHLGPYGVCNLVIGSDFEAPNDGNEARHNGDTGSR